MQPDVGSEPTLCFARVTCIAGDTVVKFQPGNYAILRNFETFSTKNLDLLPKNLMHKVQLHPYA